MSAVRGALVPQPLRVLLGRAVDEWQARQRVFDLPAARFHRMDPAFDLGITVGGRRAATPVGPAAGPHTQLAQNIVLGWLAGARVFECKTVQVLDTIEVPRPCIDMEGVGYNVEWSQELRLEQSLEEYVKAWMMLDVLGAWSPLREALGPVGGHVFDLSVGYDLAGIRSAPMAGFLDGMRDATRVIDRLRDDLPPELARFREHAFEPRVATAATLSTFHGCPPDEIGAIARHLVEKHDLDVVVKLNPTLLGFDAVSRLLHDELGYRDVRLEEAAFDADLSLDRAVDLIVEGDAHARAHGHRFGIKLTNTLVVGNDGARLPGEVRYLSGPPLHVIAVALLDRLVERCGDALDLGDTPGDVSVSWSAGVDATNVAETVGLGVRPVTVASALLKPGGYANLSRMLGHLQTSLTGAGVTRLDDWVTLRRRHAQTRGYRDAVAAYGAQLSSEAGGRHYRAAHVDRPRRQVDHRLERWRCLSCDICVSVCPNDALVQMETPAALHPELGSPRQYVCLADLCNECGNCTTFCPEVGEPWRDKPRVHLDREAFDADPWSAALLTVGDGSLRVADAHGLVPSEVDLLGTLANAWLPIRAQDVSRDDPHGASPPGHA